MSIPYTSPYLKGKAFNCPCCHAYAKQDWAEHWHNNEYYVTGLVTSRCDQCDEFAIWRHGTIIYPQTTSIENPSIDLPADVKKDYIEASGIVDKSPKAAAALLRLAIQRLCVHLGGAGKNINDDIAKLVKDGLPTKVQQMLDTVRVIGNHSVHAGIIDLDDKSQTAETLFKLINIIAEKMITEPNTINSLYNSLPEKDKEQIAKRDQLFNLDSL